jgi:hypothetical protein
MEKGREGGEVVVETPTDSHKSFSHRCIMSGVGEASLVLGLISLVIAIIQGAKQFYNAAHGTKGLLKAFYEVANNCHLSRRRSASQKPA